MVVARERLLRDLLQNDVSVGILMMLGKSENESSTNCDSHSSSATSSVGTERWSVKSVEREEGLLI